MSKLQEAINLCRKPTSYEEAKTYQENLGKAMKIFNQICLNPAVPVNDKYNALIKYFELIPDQGVDMLSRYRDCIPFLKGKQLDDLIDILIRIIQTEGIDSHERVITAVTLYNRGFIDVCYPAFMHLAGDATVSNNYRVEACRYLFATEDEDYRQIAQENLIDIVNDQSVDCGKRYEWIAGFISTTGISTVLNSAKLYVHYDESFVYGLQCSFFFNEENRVEERILSGQHLLQMKCCEEKDEVTEMLLNIAQDEKIEYNTRADAADVVLRLRRGDDRKKAREIIVSLGFRPVEGDQLGGLVDRNRNIYTDEQNVHSVTDCVDREIERIVIENTDADLPPYHQVVKEVTDLVRSRIQDTKKKYAAFKSLNRINVDTATFTKYGVTIAEILVHVWVQIKQKPKEEKELMENLLFEELIDMAGTCSSGHSGRLINVLGGITITWEEQIIANIGARITAAIRDCSDEDLRSIVATGMLKDADKEDRDTYIDFAEKELAKIEKEMYKEFVDTAYVKKKDFEKAFEEGKSKWL